MVVKQALSDLEARQAKPRDKGYKLADGGGLYLFVSPFGGKSWRYDYRVNGKRETLTIGKFPEVSLEDARNSHAEARTAVVLGISPTQEKRKEKEDRRKIMQQRGAADNARQRIAVTCETLMRQLERIEAMCKTLRCDLGSIDDAV